MELEILIYNGDRGAVVGGHKKVTCDKNGTKESVKENRNKL